MNWNNLIEIWETVQTPVRDHLSGKLLGGHAYGFGIWLAVDREGNWHLLVSVQSLIPPIIAPETRGLRVVTEALQIANNDPGIYIDLTCSERSLREPFAVFSADVIRSVVKPGSSPRDAVAEALSRWRRFWSTASVHLSREAALGLFGELWFIYRWAGLPAGIRGWTGPMGSRHDFQWPDISVEVKTTQIRSDGAAEHRITSLDQLDDPESGRLYLFSLQVSPDQISANTLSHLIGLISTELSSFPEYLGRFLDLVGLTGYTPSPGDVYEQRLRVLAEELYVIEGDFPRLRRRSFPKGLPPGVDQITYSLSLTACSPWRIATSPSQLTPSFIESLKKAPL